ncbi:hypothetical protein BV911_17130 [Pseudoruegeria sp. SK021]|nr:hypothetical protein BV911_17130 [Pseudoruegeria sp. SK021]
MLRDAPMAGLVKLHCGEVVTDERQQWAGLSRAISLQERNSAPAQSVKVGSLPTSDAPQHQPDQHRLAGHGRPKPAFLLLA